MQAVTEVNFAASLKRPSDTRGQRGSRARRTWAKAMEGGKTLESTAEEPSGVEKTACNESAVRNWRDPPLHGKP
jgi:hypothetical protein